MSGAASTWVLIGDSITEDGRRRDDPVDLGLGYVARIAAARAAAGGRERFVNSGVGGDRAVDIAARFERDALAYGPELVSIHVGINDTWRRYDGGEETSTEAFRSHYRGMTARAARSGARLVLIEPFLLPVAPDQHRWRDDLDPKIEAVRTLAEEFDAVLVPADRAFSGAARRVDPSTLLHDGVHPTDAGRDLLAETWTRAVIG